MERKGGGGERWEEKIFETFERFQTSHSEQGWVGDTDGFDETS
jgi:hypothetical protein